jgi:hypothetical protein
LFIDKYGSLGGGWMSKMPSGPYGIGLWKFIRDGWDKFSRFLKFEVGDGSQIRFWDDVWCLDESLKAAFMELYRITCVRDAAVANIIRIRSESVHWEVNFTRLVQDWELESISSFLELLYSTSIQKPEEDKMCWKVSNNKGFQVRSYYKALSSNGVGSFPWKSI